MVSAGPVGEGVEEVPIGLLEVGCRFDGPNARACGSDVGEETDRIIDRCVDVVVVDVALWVLDAERHQFAPPGAESIGGDGAVAHQEHLDELGTVSICHGFEPFDEGEPPEELRDHDVMSSTEVAVDQSERELSGQQLRLEVS